MRVRWNKQSKEQLIRAASYIRHEFSQESMNDFMAECKRKPLLNNEKRLFLMLSNQP